MCLPNSSSFYLNTPRFDTVHDGMDAVQPDPSIDGIALSTALGGEIPELLLLSIA
jgi:hypothetical protein